ncbi:MAG: hypothetical protein HUU55_09220 [Myxococcales bacterium]|nr:hypothetical protein [Myxococcales bacterium]
MLTKEKIVWMVGLCLVGVACETENSGGNEGGMLGAAMENADEVGVVQVALQSGPLVADYSLTVSDIWTGEVVFDGALFGGGQVELTLAEGMYLFMGKAFSPGFGTELGTASLESWVQAGTFSTVNLVIALSGDPLATGNAIVVVKSTGAPVVTGSWVQKNAGVGVGLAVRAKDPEGGPLTYQWTGHGFGANAVMTGNSVIVGDQQGPNLPLGATFVKVTDPDGATAGVLYSYADIYCPSCGPVVVEVFGDKKWTGYHCYDKADCAAGSRCGTVTTPDDCKALEKIGMCKAVSYRGHDEDGTIGDCENF